MFKKEQFLKNYILFALLFLLSACETGTKYEENSTKEKSKEEESHIEREKSIRALIERPSSEEKLVEKSYIDKSTVKERVVAPTPKSPHKYDPENPLNGESINQEERFVEKEEPPVEVQIHASIEPTVEPEPLPITSRDDVTFEGGKIKDGLNVKSIRVGRHKTYIRLVFDIDEWLDINSHGNSVKTVGHYLVTYSPSKNRIIVTMDGYKGFSAKFPKFSRRDVIEKIDFNEYLDDSGFQFTIELKDGVKVRAYDYKNPARLIIDITPLI